MLDNRFLVLTSTLSKKSLSHLGRWRRSPATNDADPSPSHWVASPNLERQERLFAALFVDLEPINAVARVQPPPGVANRSGSLAPVIMVNLETAESFSRLSLCVRIYNSPSVLRARFYDFRSTEYPKAHRGAGM